MGRKTNWPSPPIGAVLLWNLFAQFSLVQSGGMFDRHMVYTAQNNLGPVSWQMLWLRWWQVVQLLTAIFTETKVNSSLSMDGYILAWRIFFFSCAFTKSSPWIIIITVECLGWTSSSGSTKKRKVIFRFKFSSVF